MKSDRKSQGKVSPLEKSVEMEICKRCGTLHAWGQKCPSCGLTYEQDEAKNDAWTKSEAK